MQRKKVDSNRTSPSKSGDDSVNKRRTTPYFSPVIHLAIQSASARR
jgi:hypothetical protein